MVEVAAKNGTLRIICATSTLAEGLNMPVEMVMIVGGKHFSDDGNRARRVDMPASSFENIAGRAGRAFVSTEGLVVFVPEDYDEVSATLDQSRQYMFTDPAGLKVRSALADVLNRLLEWDHEAPDAAATDLDAVSQVVLLALNAAGIVDEEDLTRFASATLLGHRLPAPSLRGLGVKLRSALHLATQKYGPDLLRLFAQTGLSISACDTLYDALREAVNRGDDLTLRTEEELNINTLEGLIGALSQVPELWSLMKWSRLPVAVHARLVYGWLRQLDPREELSDVNLAEYNVRASVGDLYRYYGAVSNVLAWGFGVSYLFLNHILNGQADEELGALPLYAKYGVDSVEGALLSLLGVSDRRTATVLGEAFRAEHQAGASLLRIEAWLNQLEPKDVEAVLSDDEVRLQVALDDLRLERRVSVPRSVRAFLFGGPLPEPPFVRVRLEGARVVAYDLTGAMVGRFFPNDDLKEMVREGECQGLVLSSKPPFIVQVHRPLGSPRRPS